MQNSFPTTQRELLEFARGAKTRRDFADELSLDRTMWGRYEAEQRRIPPKLLNKVLTLVRVRLSEGLSSDPKQAAMHLAKATLREIARIEGPCAASPTDKATAAQKPKRHRRTKRAAVAPAGRNRESSKLVKR